MSAIVSSNCKIVPLSAIDSEALPPLPDVPGLVVNPRKVKKLEPGSRNDLQGGRKVACGREP